VNAPTVGAPIVNAKTAQTISVVVQAAIATATVMNAIVVKSNESWPKCQLSITLTL